MPTQTITYKHSEGSISFSVDVPVTSDGEQNADIALAAGAVNVEVDMAFTIAKLQLLFMLAPVAVTIKTNSSGSPQETISLTANNPLCYRANDYQGPIFLGNVTKFYASNPGAVDTVLQVRSIVDLTP